jgi:AI-2 transport protein TqsA
MIVINTVVDNMIKPHVMERGLDLPGSLTILSLLVWSWLLGPLGALLGVPLTVVIRGLLMEQSRAGRAEPAALPTAPDSPVAGPA